MKNNHGSSRDSIDDFDCSSWQAFSFRLQLIIELEYHQSVCFIRAVRKNANFGRCAVVAAF